MSAPWLFFSFSGRLNRGPFWFVSILVSISVWTLVGLSFWLGGLDPRTSIVILAISLPAAWAIVSVTVKRLHDRGKSGWWLLLFYLVPAIIAKVGETAGPAGIILIAIALCIWLWGIVEIGFRKGTVDANKFGPSPDGQGQRIISFLIDPLKGSDAVALIAGISVVLAVSALALSTQTQLQTNAASPPGTITAPKTAETRGSR